MPHVKLCGEKWWRLLRLWVHESAMEIHIGSRAHMLLIVFKTIVKCFKKNLKKFEDKHIQFFDVCAKFWNEMTLFVLCAKNTKPVAKMRTKNTFFKALFFSTEHKKWNFVLKIAIMLQTCIYLCTILFSFFLKCFTIIF